jgi:choline kinase
VKGLVLAAGPGRRLHPLTAALPKTLLPLNDGRTILDLLLANLSTVGIEDVAIVTGFAAGEIERRVSDLERRYGVRVELVFNDRAEEWNNAYSLWLARDVFGQGTLLLNGDTVHPHSVEETLLTAGGPGVLLAVDDSKALSEEAMKVLAWEDGRLRTITKNVDPSEADGEYIGVALIPSAAAGALADALETTWRRDPSLYYEDGFQELADRTGNVHLASIGSVQWVEVDDQADLDRAREIECRY